MSKSYSQYERFFLTYQANHKGHQEPSEWNILCPTSKTWTYTRYRGAGNPLEHQRTHDYTHGIMMRYTTEITLEKWWGGIGEVGIASNTCSQFAVPNMVSCLPMQQRQRLPWWCHQNSHRGCDRSWGCFSLSHMPHETRINGWIALFQGHDGVTSNAWAAQQQLAA